MTETARDVIDFWYRDGMPTRWFAHDVELDREIAARFGKLHQRAERGELDDWQETSEGVLALILLLDQFSRNLHRGQPGAFANDAKALALTRKAIEMGQGDAMPAEWRMFLYMPLMHSELLPDQALCVELFERLEIDPAFQAALAHQDIIARFGRFPHRNAVLGRPSTDEEIAFMKDHKGF